MSAANLIPRGHLQKGDLLDLLTRAKSAHLYGTINLGDDVRLTFVDGRIVATSEAGEGPGRQRMANILAELTEQYSGWYWIGPIVDTPEAHELPTYQAVALLRQADGDRSPSTRAEDRSEGRVEATPPQIPPAVRKPRLPEPVVTAEETSTATDPAEGIGTTDRPAPKAVDGTDPTRTPTSSTPDPAPAPVVDEPQAPQTPAAETADAADRGAVGDKRSTVEEMRRRRQELRRRGEGERRLGERRAAVRAAETAAAIQRLVAAAPDLDAALSDREQPPVVPRSVREPGTDRRTLAAPELPTTTPPTTTPPAPAPPAATQAPSEALPRSAPNPEPAEPETASSDDDRTGRNGPTRKTALRKLIRSLVN